ncbi:hypothetical protein GOODEAATRI_016135 [Goodea atripinnis]|uniref:Spondin domain-containing protein n=1 Tax=Goodea atripinnis TaxID=208336 RepID=A0ABV0N408_9TELE
MWQSNEFASNGVREFAEKGEAWTIMEEVETAGERIQSVYGILSAPAVVGGTGQMNTQFEVFARHSYLSFIVRIVPSPDWFVGADRVDLCDGDHWKEKVTLELFPYDAGTDSGFTFSSPNFETIPQDRIMQGRTDRCAPLCPDTPLDCEVSAWSPWGLCKGKCGDSGVQHRTRYIIMHPANNGAACPQLEEERKCFPDNCL